MMRFTIPSMTCGHCAKAVTEAVEAVDDLAEVDIDLDTKLVTIESDAPETELRTALTEANYAPA